MYGLFNSHFFSKNFPGFLGEQDTATGKKCTIAIYSYDDREWLQRQGTSSIGFDPSLHLPSLRFSLQTCMQRLEKHICLRKRHEHWLLSKWLACCHLWVIYYNSICWQESMLCKWPVCRQGMLSGICLVWACLKFEGWKISLVNSNYSLFLQPLQGKNDTATTLLLTTCCHVIITLAQSYLS